MRKRQRAAWVCFAVALFLVASSLAWQLANAKVQPALLPPAGEALATKVPFRFAVLGDSRGNQAVLDRLLESIKRDGAALILFTGDMVDNCTCMILSGCLRR